MTDVQLAAIGLVLFMILLAIDKGTADVTAAIDANTRALEMRAMTCVEVSDG